MTGSLREQLKRQSTVRGRRWIIKYDSSDNIREVKMIYNPQEYIQLKRPRRLHGDKELLELLEIQYERPNRNK